ncbi:hypothetical protein CRE_25625 [Caenorhabditis remanei]|uniref:RRM domain-containing protein n=1 Tax=Caenorhabditis remanei TaxID=31234 RepID=E3ML32_CAERE|nr:hypothetical protein CRE_25625 [Caenorhabditis remanei]
MVEKSEDSKKRGRSSSSSSSSSSGSSSSGTSSSGSRSSSSSSSSCSPRRRENGRVRGGRSRSPIRRGGSPPRGARADRGGGRPSPSPPRRRRVTPSPPRRDRRDRSRSGPRRRSSPRRASPAPARSASPIKRVVIKNLSRNVLRAHLEEIFSIYGAITKVDLPVDRNHQHLHRGIGYIDYESVEDAEKSIKYMDGGQVDGQVIQVEMTIGGRAFVSGQRRVSPFRRRASPPPRDRKSPIRQEEVHQHSADVHQWQEVVAHQWEDVVLVPTMHHWVQADSVVEAVVLVRQSAEDPARNLLPLYAEDNAPIAQKFVPEEPLPLQREFATVRIACQEEYSRVAERFKVVDCAMSQTKKAATRCNEYLTEEWTALPKATAITVGGKDCLV